MVAAARLQCAKARGRGRRGQVQRCRGEPGASRPARRQAIRARSRPAGDGAPAVASGCRSSARSTVTKQPWVSGRRLDCLVCLSRPPVLSARSACTLCLHCLPSSCPPSTRRLPCLFFIRVTSRYRSSPQCQSPPAILPRHSSSTSSSTAALSSRPSSRPASSAAPHRRVMRTDCVSVLTP